MKPAPFAYVRAASLDEAIGALAAATGSARPLAGGQSLSPMLNMRLLRPAVVVDLNRIEGLAGIVVEGDETVVGAMTRYADLERSQPIAERLPLLPAAIRRIGDRQVRNRGTVGGSLAQADPTGEMVLACLALDARVVVAGTAGERVLGIEELIEGAYQTVLEADELIVAVRFPRAGLVYSFAETGRKHNDFAIAGVAVVGRPREDGTWAGIRIALNGLDDHQVLATTSAALLEGTALDDESIDAAVEAALAVAEPVADVRAAADYREAVAAELLRRTLVEQRRKGARADG